MLVMAMREVGVRRGDRWLLSNISWQVHADQRWAVLGPNGAGKTTLLRIAAGRAFPTTGEVELLGQRLGAVDLRDLRPQVGWSSAALELPHDETVLDVVLTGAYAVTGRWREDYGPQDRDRAMRLLDAWGIAPLADRPLGSLSEGERKRTLVARALMSDPELLVLDEPAAGIDLGGREDLLGRLGRLAADSSAPAQILVTHHVEEIPPGTTHALLLRQGRIVGAGDIRSVLTAPLLGATFDLPLDIAEQAGRWTARLAGSP